MRVVPLWVAQFGDVSWQASLGRHERQAIDGLDADPESPLGAREIGSMPPNSSVSLRIHGQRVDRRGPLSHFIIFK
jgi:hypothetical protein